MPGQSNVKPAGKNGIKPATGYPLSKLRFPTLQLCANNTAQIWLQSTALKKTNLSAVSREEKAQFISALQTQKSKELLFGPMAALFRIQTGEIASQIMTLG